MMRAATIARISLQGVEKDRGRDFRSKADVDAEFESARDPIERVALRREPEDFSRVALADRLEERNGLVLVRRHYFPFRSRPFGAAPHTNHVQLVARITTYLQPPAQTSMGAGNFFASVRRSFGRPDAYGRRQAPDSTLPEAGGHGQIYLPPSGALKQPINSGNTVFGSQSTALGKKIAKAIVAKKIT